MAPEDFQDTHPPAVRHALSRGRQIWTRDAHLRLHPYLTGLPYRIGALDAALKYICKHKKVWKATGSEIARHYRAQLKDGRTRGKEAGGEGIVRHLCR